MVRSICDNKGRKWKKPKEISKAFVEFYKKLFSIGLTESIEVCLARMEARVSEEMNT
jgi:Leu/Phe-tRNA-protein transferase